MSVRSRAWSRYSSPARWSVSCWTMRAGQPVRTSSIGVPVSSRPVSRTRRCRATTACHPCTDRQPSWNAARSGAPSGPGSGSYAGSSSTRYGSGARSRGSSAPVPASSTTAIASPIPTCGAASPTPGAACIVRRIASSRRASASPSCPVYEAAGARSTGAPACTIGRIPVPGPSAAASARSSRSTTAARRASSTPAAGRSAGAPSVTGPAGRARRRRACPPRRRPASGWPPRP